MPEDLHFDCKNSVMRQDLSHFFEGGKGKPQYLSINLQYSVCVCVSGWVCVCLDGA